MTPQPEIIPYATPDNPIGPDDYYYLRVLAYSHWTFGLFLATAGALFCTLAPRTEARLAGAGLVGFSCLLVMSGQFLRMRRYAWFILSVSGVAILSMPFGTIVGLSTIVIFRRPGVAKLFVDSDPTKTDRLQVE